MTYSDPEFNAKLEEAIRLGFITRDVGEDGVIQYGLTSAGRLQWFREKYLGVGR